MTLHAIERVAALINKIDSAKLSTDTAYAILIDALFAMEPSRSDL